LYSIRQSSTSTPGFQQAGQGLHGQPEGQGKEDPATAGIADALIVLGLVFMTLIVYGIVRFPTSTRSCTPRARRPF
jgi:hypothetical protein